MLYISIFIFSIFFYILPNNNPFSTPGQGNCMAIYMHASFMCFCLVLTKTPIYDLRLNN